ncbi:large ribosomal subunit protein bL20 [Parasteatoda tepidariorum]|uniref:large ribosomal subunit protein bL20 n=1 Tax=Parasteatoda tepidariorum TaxID=114398 RepID=UPI00077FC5FB|nr:39S ribosomal protein L20, mitochondrial [Parasteatoda tepidariorum]
MVFLSLPNFITKTGYDVQFKRQKVLKLTAKYFGRRRNCYSIAIKFLQKALRYATATRKVKPAYVGRLRVSRIDAACQELNTDYRILSTNLIKCNLGLRNNVLQDLAIWEPRTFKCLTDIAVTKNKIEAPDHIKDFLKMPGNVITRGML